MIKVPQYPEISIVKNEDSFILQTTLRIKREGKWYDIICKDAQINKSFESVESRFKDNLMKSHLFFKIEHWQEPSKNQEETIYKDFEDINWQNRIKNDLTLIF